MQFSILLIVWLWLLCVVHVVLSLRHPRDFCSQTVNHLSHRDRHRVNPKREIDRHNNKRQLIMKIDVKTSLKLTWSESSLFLLSVLILCTERSDVAKCDSGPFVPRCAKLIGGLIGSSSSSSSSQSEPISESVRIKWKNWIKKSCWYVNMENKYARLNWFVGI